MRNIRKKLSSQLSLVVRSNTELKFISIHFWVRTSFIGTKKGVKLSH